MTVGGEAVGVTATHAPSARLCWPLLAAGVSLLSLAGVLVQIFWHGSNPCAFADARSSGAMAAGQGAGAPFSRRIAVPDLVSRMPAEWSLTTRFETLAVFSVVVTAVAVVLLARRLLALA